MKKQNGFTLMELMITLSIVAIVSGVVIYALNPVQQLARARNTQRWSNINSILNAVGQNKADNNGLFSCGAGAIPNATTVIGISGYNIENCIVPTYVGTLPLDPVTGTANDSGYSIREEAATGRVTVHADDAELGVNLSATR